MQPPASPADDRDSDTDTNTNTNTNTDSDADVSAMHSMDDVRRPLPPKAKWGNLAGWLVGLARWMAG